jgi:tetratricopeptide (TPR) repeat protein/predicted Ser/Thr protein kinase
MHCPICQAENPPTAASCTKCSTPLPLPLPLPLDDATRYETVVDRPSFPEPIPGASLAWSIAVTPSVEAPYAQGEELVGTLLAERYEILSLLGQGGMGAVYKARDTELERMVALKLIRPDLASNPEILRRFKQELILAREVTHRNVIRIFDLGQTKGFKFITMEYVEGRDLRALLRERGKLPADEAVEIVSQVCSALETAHAAGVVHRDLKPQNIMQDAKGRIFVMDFGIAHSLETPGMTQTGALMGTPEYMSPEQARGMKVDARSDLFAFGIIFYELLTGISPFKAESALATLLKRTQERAKPPAEIDPAIPKTLSDVVMKCLEIQLPDRYQSAKEVSEALDAWKAGSSKAVVVPSMRWDRRMQRHRTTIVAAAAATGMCVLVAAGVFVYRLKHPSGPAVAHAPVSVLVADFTNQTGDPIFDGTLEPMFNVALEGASFINAYNRGEARKLADKLPNPTGKLDEQSARLVGISQGVSAIVTGTLNSQGGGYQLATKAVDAVTGKTLATTEATAKNKDEVLLNIPSVIAPLRKALGDTTPVSAQLAAAQGSFAAANLDAVHQYGVAMELQFAGKTEQALQAFSKAVKLDPNFARAYSGMAAAYGNSGRTTDAEKYAKLALEHIDRMSERERYRTRGEYYIESGNWQKCVEEYGALVSRYPVDNAGHANLSLCYSQLRNWPKAVEEARQDVDIHADAIGLANLGLFSSYAGDFAGGEKVARRLLQLSPTFEYGYYSLAFAQTGQDQLSPAADTYQKLAGIGDLGASRAASGLADLDMYQGRFADAVKILEKGAAADLAGKRGDSAAEKFTALAYTQLSLGQYQAAVAAADKALASSQEVKIRFLAARTYVEAGEFAKVQKLADGLAAELQPEPQAYAKIISGDIALKRNEYSAAIKNFTDANNLLDTWIGRFDLGRAYLSAGAFTEADSEFDACIKRRGETLALFLDEVPTYSFFPPVYYYQGRVRQGLKSPGFAEPFLNYMKIRGKSTEDPLVSEIHHLIGQ